MSVPENNSSPGGMEALEAIAGVWLSLRDRGMNATETEAFMRWLQEDPRHASVFATLDETWRDLDQLSTLVRPGTPANPDTLAPRYRRRLAKVPMLAFGTAAALAALLCVFAWRGHLPAHFAETSIGAFQNVELPDGSTAQLNTDSAIDVDMRPTERGVRVVRGEVHFTVKKDSSRPFIATADNIRVKAIGTAFVVRSRETAVEVLVTEGRVQLQDLNNQLLALPGDPIGAQGVSAGQRALVPTTKGDRLVIRGEVQLERISDEEIRRRLAWQGQRLEFDSTPLGEVVAEFNRYNRTQLVVEDPEIGTRPFTGSFRADGYEAFAALLEKNFGVTIAREAGRIRLGVR